MFWRLQVGVQIQYHVKLCTLGLDSDVLISDHM